MQLVSDREYRNAQEPGGNATEEMHKIFTFNPPSAELKKQKIGGQAINAGARRQISVNVVLDEFQDMKKSETESVKKSEGPIVDEFAIEQRSMSFDSSDK